MAKRYTGSDMGKTIGGILLALLLFAVVLTEQRRITHSVAAKRETVLRKQNAAMEELIQSCGRPQHESAMFSPSPQLTYDSYHLTITLTLSSKTLQAAFVDAETDNQVSREAAVHIMPCLAHWLAQQTNTQAQR
jgi:hypothetical protein